MKQYVAIDSRDRDTVAYPTTSTYAVKLPQTFHNVTAARLMTAEIPHAFFQFASARNNTSMVFRRDGVLKTVTIHDGSYATTADLATAVELALEAAYGDIGAQFTVTVSNTTKRMTIFSAGATTLDMLASDQVDTGLLWKCLGFVLDISGSSTIVGLHPVQLIAEPYIMLDIDELSSVHETGPNAGTAGPAFAKIPISVAPFATMFWDKQVTANYIDPPIARLTDISITLRYHDGAIVDFGAHDHSFTIELECSQERSTW